METKNISLDHKVIFAIVERGSKVLDLGCGTGDLIELLSKEKGVRAQGIEIDDEAIYKCVEKGLPVFHGDIDTGLSEYPDKSFDYVILNQSMQQVKQADLVIHEGLRVGKKLIVGFPNFAYIKARADMFFRGRTPVTPALPFYWYDTPNLHFLTIKDFEDYCKRKGINVLEEHYLGRRGEVTFFPNLFALNGVFVLSK